MGVEIYYGYYTKKCNDKDILPFLDTDISGYELNGKHMPDGFYDTCREIAKHDEEADCYIFDDVTKLFDFASRENVPSNMSDYITEFYSDNVPIFIIWIR